MSFPDHCDGSYCEIEVEGEPGEGCAVKAGNPCRDAAPTPQEAAGLAALNHPDHKCIFQRVKEAETHVEAVAEIDGFFAAYGIDLRVEPEP